MRALLVVVCACSGEPVVDVACGSPGNTWNANAHDNQDCTHALGSVHVSDSGEADFRWMPKLRVIDGSLTFFRNDAATSLGGFESLERVGGRFGAHFHRALHDADFHALAERIEVGGPIEIFDNAER